MNFIYAVFSFLISYVPSFNIQISQLYINDDGVNALYTCNGNCIFIKFGLKTLFINHNLKKYP